MQNAKRFFSLFSCFLCLLNWLSLETLAQEIKTQTTSQSAPVAVAFGKDGKLLKLANSQYLSVGVNSPVPSLSVLDPASLPPLEGERKIKLTGSGFINNTIANLIDSESTKRSIPISILNQKEAEITVNISNNDIAKGKLSLQLENKDIKGLQPLKSEILEIPLGYSAPKLIDNSGKSLVYITPSVGVAPQIVTFNGAEVFNPDDRYLANPGGLMFLWDFGDLANSTNTENKESTVVTHKYDKPGKYIVSLNVINDYGKTSLTTKEIEIREKNFAPSGTFEATSTKGDVPFTITFTPKVIDKENDEISYQWDFGDGQTSIEKNPSHTYTIPGKYEPKLTVVDTLSAKTIVGGVKLTLLPANNKPNIEIAGVPETSILKQNTEGLFTSEVQFVSNGTYDPDGEELSYNWDFGDGNTSSEINPKHEYKTSGNYKTKLTVKDPRNSEVSKEINITVEKPKPVLTAKINETTGNAPFEVTFDSTGSSDYDGMTVSLIWDFGDGQGHTTDSTNSIIKHTYNDPGVYLVRLTAQATGNRFSVITPASIITGPAKGVVGRIAFLEGERTGVLGIAKVKLSAAGSYDPDLSTSPLKYTWSWNAMTWNVDGNLIDISEEVNKDLVNNLETFEYTFKQAGQYTPVLEIEKSNGTKSKFFGETITISPAQGPIAKAKITSDKNIVEPNTEIGFDGSESYDPKVDGGIKLFSWDFGDGEKSNEISPKHVYIKEGTFTPTLVVVSNNDEIAFAQTDSVTVRKEAISNNLRGRHSVINRYEIATSPPQAGPRNDSQTEEEVNNATQSMLKQALDSYTSSDNEKPEIGPVTLEPKTVKAGGVLTLKAFIKDNVALNNFGYSLISPEGKLITGTLINLIGEENISQEDLYIEEKIAIPETAIPGNYKLKLTATDTNLNQVAKDPLSLQPSIEKNNNEEITLEFTVSSEKEISKAENITEPSSVSPVKDATTLLSRVSHPVIARRLPRRHFPPNDRKEANLKYQIEVTNLVSGSNPWYPRGWTSVNSLTLNVVSDKNGIIEIGTKGSLNETQYNKWWYTNIYVDSKYTGRIGWYNSAIISFNSTNSNENVSVEFRPADSFGNDLPSGTWKKGFFTFTKISPPEVTSLSRYDWTSGRGAFDLVVYGNNFRESSKVIIDGYSLSPLANSSNYILVRVPASFVNYPSFKTIIVRNIDGTESRPQYLTVKANENNPCNLNKSLPQTYYGADAFTRLDGNNVYLSSPSALVEGTGSVTIPFCLDNSYEAKASLNLTHLKNDSSACSTVSYWLDNSYISSSNICVSGESGFDNLNIPPLQSGYHEFKVSFSGPSLNKLLIDRLTLTNGGGPILESLSPSSFALEGENRTLTIYGRNFDQNTSVYLNDELKSKVNFTGSQITISLPSKFTTVGSKTIYLKNSNKESGRLSFTVRDNIEIIANTFKINPVQPFPGNSFDIELAVKDKISDGLNPQYTCAVAVFDPDDNLIRIPNFSTNTGTTILEGTVENPDPLNRTISFKGSVPLSINSKPGNYKVFVAVKRKSSFNTDLNQDDYSSFETFKYITSRTLGLSSSENVVPASHRLTFTPKPAVTTVFGIEENSAENKGFVQVGNKVIQDGQEIKYKIIVSSGQEYLSNLRFNFKSGDGRESGLTSNDNVSFTYENKDLSTQTPKTFNPQIEIFWVENGQETKRGTYNGPTVLVYPNYKPIAKARVFREQFEKTYATVPPLKTGFIDVDSYDPNQRFSSSIDFVNPKDNDWKLYRGILGQNETVIATPIDSSISEDKKTFFSGSLYTPGTYFAKLTVKDQTNLTDTASTESVTVARPHQRLIVWASTDPQDSKVYDPTATPLPVKFKSEVTTLGGNADLNYRWDFGDGSCKSNELPSDCTSPNPTHYYFDGKRSFAGKPYIDRKSVTPKLTVSARFSNGHTESWDVSAGTITFNADPNFVLLDIKPEQQEGIVPFTVNLMIDPTTAKAVNATVTKYEIDFGEVVASGSEAIPTESGETTFDQLLTKTFTHTYNNPGTYNPKLTIYVEEGNKKFVFDIPTITVAGTGTGGVYLLDNLSTLSFTNQPIVTFMILASFPNPNDTKNSLRIKIKDEDGVENITELDELNQNQTVSLSEGKNTYYFETSDSSNQVIMSEVREIVLDTVEPAINKVFADYNSVNNTINISGNVVEKTLQKVEVELDNGIPVILSSDNEITLLDNETDEYKITKKLENVSDSKHNLLIRAYDFGGNISENAFELNKGNNKVLLNQISIKDINSPTIISNKLSSATKPEIFEVYEKAVSGKPFELKLNICFCDDDKQAEDNVEAKLDISNISLTEGSLNGKNIESSNLQNVFDFLTNFKQAGCVDIAKLSSSLVKPFCSDGYATACRNTCVHLNNAVCDLEVLSSKLLNNSELNDLFSPIVATKYNPTKQWDIGKYEFKFTVNENPETCSDSTYATCLGQNYSEKITSQTYKYTIDVVRDPKTEVIIPAENSKLNLNEDKEIRLNITTIDNLPFSESRKPAIDLTKAKWDSNLISISNLEKISESIDPANPKKYNFEIKGNLTSKTLKKTTLEIPIIFPADYFNPQGITVSSYGTFTTNADFSAEISAPQNAQIVNGKTSVSSKVTKPNDLTGDLNPIDNCGKSVISYGIKIGNNPTTINIANKNIETKLEKVSSRGKKEISSISFKDLINFNLKNIKEFKEDFLNGNIFGPIQLFGEYSTSCTLKNLEYTGSSKNYILLDNPKIIKGKCTSPQDLEYSKCKIVTSNNTLSDNYSVTISGNDPQKCPVIPEESNKFTRTYLVNCLPKGIASFDVAIKRSTDFINKIQDRINSFPELQNTNITQNQEVITPDKKSFEVKNVQQDDDSSEVFKVGDGEDKTATFNFLGEVKALSVHELKDFLSQSGYASFFINDLSSNGYTENVDKAFKAYISNFKIALQRLENEYGISVDISEDGSISYSEVSATIRNQEINSSQEELTKKDLIYVQLAKEFLIGLKDGGVNEVSSVLTQLQNPETIMFIITTGVIFAGVSSITFIQTWLPLISTILIGAGITAAEIDTLNQAITYYSNQNNPSTIRLFGFVSGKLITATVALDGIVKLIERLVSLRWFSKLIKTNSLNNYSNIQNLLDDELKSLSSVISKEERLTKLSQIQRFTQILDKLSDSAKTVLSNAIQRLIARNYDKLLLIRKFGLTSKENLDLLIKVMNRDGLTIQLTDQELNDLLFTIARNVKDERLNPVIQRVANNLISGKISEPITTGRRILREDAALQVLNGERTLANLSGKTFCIEIEDISNLSDLELITSLGLDTISDLDRFLGYKVYTFEIPTNGLTLELPNSTLGNDSFINGGITSGGEFEFWIDNGWTTKLYTKFELEGLGVKILERQPIKLSEINIRKLLNESLNPPTNDQIEGFITNLKGAKRI